MVSMTEVDRRIDAGFTRGGQEVGYKREWVAILLGDLVQSTEVNTESE